MSTIELAGVAIARGGRTLVHDVNVRFEAGTLTAIVGANGAGKTSLLATLCGLTPPAAGRVLLDGSDLARLAPRERARAIALVDPGEPVLTAMTVGEAVAGGRFPHHRWWQWQATPADDDAVRAALGATQLTGLRAREVGTLSAGERQRVWLALALAQRASILVLDEPTAHLDLRHAVDTLERQHALARAGTTVVAVLHSLEEAAAFADRVIVLGDGGILADGPPAHALTEPVLQRAFGVEIGVVERDGTLAFARKQRGLAADAARPGV